MANFKNLDSIDGLDALFEKSNDAPVVLFKHSLTCPISHGVYAEVEQFGGDVNLVVVQHSRDISNEIAARTGIRHESPQAIVIRNGKPVYNASHYDVTAGDLASAAK